MCASVSVGQGASFVMVWRASTAVTARGAIYYIESHCVRKDVPHSYERGDLLVKAIDGQLVAGGADPDGLPQINIIFIKFMEGKPSGSS